MAESREDLVKWSLEKAEEYLSSAKENLGEGRLFVAAEEIFRAIETSLEAMLFQEGVTKISYPGREKEFVGRLALQFLVRDNLVRKAVVSRADYDNYLAYASALHQAGYKYGSFEEKKLNEALAYAEDLFHRALARKK